MEIKELVLRLINDDEAVFEVIYYRYRGKVGNFIRKSLPSYIDLEETVHEVFLRIWMNRKKLNPEQCFEAYLFKIARNLVIDKLRGNIDQLIYLQDDTAGYDLGINDVEAKIEDKELQVWLNDILKQLPDKRREIFLMSRTEDLSYKEIASKLGISENTVDTQIRRALLFLRSELKKLNLLLFLL